MVIAEDRRAVRDAILRYMRGDIDNFALDEATFERWSDDHSVSSISIALWASYDDFKRHSVSVTRQGWKFYRRCAAFLETDLEVPDKLQRPPGDHVLWPFPSWQSMYAHRRQFSQPDLPAYNADIHGRPTRTSGELLYLQIKTVISLTVVVGIFAYLGYRMFEPTVR